MRTIDADKLIKVVKQHKVDVSGKGAFGEAYAMAHDHIIEIIEILAGGEETNGHKRSG